MGLESKVSRPQSKTRDARREAREQGSTESHPTGVWLRLRRATKCAPSWHVAAD